MTAIPVATRRSARAKRTMLSPSPPSPSSPIPTARSIGRSKACSRSPICIWKKAQASPRAACCCRLTTPRRRLARLTKLIARYAPRVVVALGDSFHDGGGPARLGEEDRDNILALQRGRDWIWITGNHDPEPADGIGGAFRETLTIGALTFRHLPTGSRGEICRPSASGGAHRATRPRGQPALLCRRHNAHGDAGLRRFHRRTECARRGLCRSVRHAGLHRAYAGRGPALRFCRQAVSAGLVSSEHHAAEPAGEQRHHRRDDAVEQAVVVRGVGDKLFEAGLDHFERRIGARHQIAVGKQFDVDGVVADRRIGRPAEWRRGTPSA